MAVKTKDTNRIPELMEELTGIKNRTIEAGILESGKQAMIAHVHEYGIDIAVTPRMRAFLHHIDIHLKKTTTHIRIPERSYLRSGWDNNKDKIIKKIELLTNDVLDFGIDAETFLEMIGLEVEGKLKEQIVEISSPPLHPVTKERKGSSNPLIDTGSLLSSIDYEVK